MSNGAEIAVSFICARCHELFSSRPCNKAGMQLYMSDMIGPAFAANEMHTGRKFWTRVFLGNVSFVVLGKMLRVIYIVAKDYYGGA